MAPGPLGQGRADHIDAVIKRPLQVCGREGIVDDEGQAVVVRQVGDGFEIRDLEGGVGAGLAEEC